MRKGFSNGETMKATQWLILAAHILGAALTAPAQFTCATNGAVITVTAYNGPGGAVTIPSFVTAIGPSAFYTNANITSLTMGSNVNTIAQDAFIYCTMTNVIFDNALANIGEGAFYSCRGLSSVEIPASVTNIGIQAFGQCTRLQQFVVDLNNAAYSSSNGVLFDHSRTVLVEFPAGITGSYSVPAGVTTIGNSAFYSGSLSNIYLPSTVTNVQYLAFVGGPLASILVDSNNLFYSSLDGVLFNKNQTELIELPGDLAGTYTVPATVQSIAPNAAHEPFGLVSLVIQSGVTNIGSNAFWNGGLTNVKLGSNVMSIGSQAFAYNWNLTNVTFLGNAPATDPSAFSGDSNASICYTAGTTGWTDPFAGIPAVVCGGTPIGPAPQILLSAPSANGSYYGMYSSDATAAAFTLTNNYYVSTIDVSLYAPAGTPFNTFTFTLQNSLTNPATIASQSLTASLGVQSIQVMDVNQTLLAGTYYLTGIVPGYAGTTVTPGDVDGWVISSGNYNQTAGSIANGLWVAQTPPLFDTGGMYVAPAFTVNGYLSPLQNNTNYFEDTFESYSPGSFPSSGGWELIYDGAGSAYQVVGPAPQRGGQALELVGSSCWDGAAFNPQSLPDRFTLEADVLIAGNLSGGCTVNDAQFGIYNPSIGVWGTPYGIVYFENDGQIHASGDGGAGTAMMPYQENTWYHIACDYDLVNKTMGVRINGGAPLAGVAITPAGSPSGIWLDAGHGANPTLWIDNLTLTTAGLINIYSTGLDNQFNPLPPGNTDPHYTIISAPAGTVQTPPFAPYLVYTNGCPFNGAWLNNDAASQWLAVQSNYTCITQDPVGNYDYQTTFDLTGLDPASAALTFKYLADNVLEAVLINGTNAGLTFSTPSDFATWLGPYEITNNFVPGTNTLDFIVYNSSPAGGNPSGLRVQISGSAAVAAGPPTIITAPASQTNAIGNPATFTVAANGAMPLSYQWLFDNQPIPGATNSAYTIASIVSSNSGSYSVMVTNDEGMTNATATLTIEVCVAAPLGLAAWWPGNGNADDIVGGNSGTLEGGVSYVAGQSGLAFDFNGTGTVEVPDSPALDFAPSGAMTIELWAYRASSASIMHLVGKRIGCDTMNYQLAFNETSGEGLVFGNGGGDEVATGVSLPVNSWHHLAGTFDGTTYRFYLDGALIGANSGTLGNPNTSPLLIGDAGTCASFVGMMQNISIYNRALSAAEVEAIYSSGAANKCLAPATAPAIISRPASQSKVAGGPVTFAVVATGASPLSYQWSIDNQPIAGATTSAYSIAAVVSSNAGSYSVSITNMDGATNATATLTVLPTNVLTPPPGWLTRDKDFYGSRNGGYASVNVNVSTYGSGWNVQGASFPLTGNVLGTSGRQLVVNVPGGIGIYNGGGARVGFISTQAQLACLGDVNGDGVPEILAVQPSGSYNFDILVYEGNGKLLKTIPIAGTGQSDQTVTPLFVADLNEDGQSEIVSQLTSGYGVAEGGLRGWEVTSYASGQREWRSAIGPVPDALRWNNVQGNNLIGAAWGPYNGNVGTDGTSDSANYTWNLAPGSGANWIRSYLAGGFYDSGVLLPDLNGNGTRQIIATTTAHGWSFGDYGYGQIHLLNQKNGADVTSINLAHYVDVMNGAFGNLGGGPGDELVLATYEGTAPHLRVYGSNLVASASYSRTNGQFIPAVVADLAGTGVQQILAVYQPVSGDDRLVILNGALSQTLWEQDLGAQTIQNVVVDDLNGNGQLEVIATLTPASGVSRVLVLEPGGQISPGSLQVDISPAIVRALWQVDCGTFHTNGATVTNLAAGSHLLSFAPLAGWIAPASRYVTITNGEPTVITVPYTSNLNSSFNLNWPIFVTNGAGRISGAGQPGNPVVNKTYTVTARPNAGNSFIEWLGGPTNSAGVYSVFGTNATLKFTNTSGLLLAANFATNAFATAKGMYYGLFAPPASVAARDQTNSGAFNIDLTQTGSVSGKLQFGAKSVPLNGNFGADGSANLISKTTGITTTLQLDLAAQSVSGTVSDGSFIAELNGFQQEKTDSYAGHYTLVIPGSSTSSNGPFGTSCGTLTVSSIGTISFSGNLADGTAVTESSVVSTNGYWPMFIPLYGGKGSLWSWNYFTNGAISSPSGASWINMTNASKSASYRIGFTNQAASIVGTNFVSTDSPLLNLTDGVVLLTAANSAFTVSNQVALASNDTISNAPLDTNNLKLKINKTTGAITGSFRNPLNAGQTLKISGVLMQSQTNAQGFFSATNVNGSFLLAP